MIRFVDRDAQRAAATAARLATDIARLVAGDAPTARELETAPVLDGWAPGLAMHPILFGSVDGHPLLGALPLIRTSRLYAYDLEAGWARTWSRFYRLGVTEQERAHGPMG